MGVGIALYAVASVYELGSSEKIIKGTVKCKYCRKKISEKVNTTVSTSRGTSTNFLPGKSLFQLYKLDGWTRRSLMSIQQLVRRVSTWYMLCTNICGHLILLLFALVCLFPISVAYT